MNTQGWPNTPTPNPSSFMSFCLFYVHAYMQKSQRKSSTGPIILSLLTIWILNSAVLVWAKAVCVSVPMTLL